MRLSELSLEVVAAVNRERFEHSHPEVRRKMLVVWLRSQGFDQATCATIADVSVRTVRRYLQQFQEGGLDRLRQIRWTGTDGRTDVWRRIACRSKRSFVNGRRTRWQRPLTALVC